MPAPDELSLFAVRLEATGAPYMVTGATAAILYGQPRVTNDLDVVLSLDDATGAALLRAFPETDFYVPPESVIRTEQARAQRGHFNLIHHESGYKDDIYLTGRPLACVGPAAAPPSAVERRGDPGRGTAGIRRTAQARVLPGRALGQTSGRHPRNP
jgi:hypothetical protein